MTHNGNNSCSCGCKPAYDWSTLIPPTTTSNDATYRVDWAEVEDELGDGAWLGFILLATAFTFGVGLGAMLAWVVGLWT